MPHSLSLRLCLTLSNLRFVTYKIMPSCRFSSLSQICDRPFSLLLSSQFPYSSSLLSFILNGNKTFLRGYICLVTGASRGIGRGVAIGLGECGATVYITARTLTPKNESSDGATGSLEETAAEITARGGVAIPVAVDHADDSQVTNLFSRIRREQNGRLDILVNNVYSGVGVLTAIVKEHRKFWELGPDESPALIWDSVNRVGLRNHYICSVLAARLMLGSRNELNEDSEDNANGVKPSERARPGLIFNISSVGGLRHFFAVVYGVGKSAVDRMTADMAEELRSRKKSLSVISIWPGFVRTEMMLSNMKGSSKSFPLDIETQSESPELTGRIIAAIAMETREELLARSGRVFIVADVANSLGIHDIDGRSPVSFRSYKILLQVAGWKRLAALVPSFLKVPYCLLKPTSPRF
uniref:Dehydrogenase:reductase SDR family n=1 Tax=Echinococcus granulosus TaxID=6210 RepID=A0A068WVC0_ECHGR|nr:Dehydrogenase:reductase SDR family [Echinococcus granulosus]